VCSRKMALLLRKNHLCKHYSRTLYTFKYLAIFLILAVYFVFLILLHTWLPQVTVPTTSVGKNKFLTPQSFEPPALLFPLLHEKSGEVLGGKILKVVVAKNNRFEATSWYKRILLGQNIPHIDVYVALAPGLSHKQLHPGIQYLNCSGCDIVSVMKIIARRLRTQVHKTPWHEILLSKYSAFIVQSDSSLVSIENGGDERDMVNELQAYSLNVISPCERHSKAGSPLACVLDEPKLTQRFDQVCKISLFFSREIFNPLYFCMNGLTLWRVGRLLDNYNDRKTLPEAVREVLDVHTDSAIYQQLHLLRTDDHDQAKQLGSQRRRRKLVCYTCSKPTYKTCSLEHTRTKIYKTRAKLGGHSLMQPHCINFAVTLTKHKKQKQKKKIFVCTLDTRVDLSSIAQSMWMQPVSSLGMYGRDSFKGRKILLHTTEKCNYSDFEGDILYHVLENCVSFCRKLKHDRFHRNVSVFLTDCSCRERNMPMYKFIFVPRTVHIAWNSGDFNMNIVRAKNNASSLLYIYKSSYSQSALNLILSKRKDVERFRYNFSHSSTPHAMGMLQMYNAIVIDDSQENYGSISPYMYYAVESGFSPMYIGSRFVFQVFSSDKFTYVDPSHLEKFAGIVPTVPLRLVCKGAQDKLAHPTRASLYPVLAFSRNGVIAKAIKNALILQLASHKKDKALLRKCSPSLQNMFSLQSKTCYYDKARLLAPSICNTEWNDQNWRWTMRGDNIWIQNQLSLLCLSFSILEKTVFMEPCKSAKHILVVPSSDDDFFLKASSNICLEGGKDGIFLSKCLQTAPGQRWTNVGMENDFMESSNEKRTLICLGAQCKRLALALGIVFSSIEKLNEHSIVLVSMDDEFVRCLSMQRDAISKKILDSEHVILDMFNGLSRHKNIIFFNMNIFLTTGRRSFFSNLKYALEEGEMNVGSFGVAIHGIEHIEGCMLCLNVPFYLLETTTHEHVNAIAPTDTSLPRLLILGEVTSLLLLKLHTRGITGSLLSYTNNSYYMHTHLKGSTDRYQAKAVPPPKFFAGFAFIFDTCRDSSQIPQSLKFVINHRIPFVFYSKFIELRDLSRFHNRWFHPCIREIVSKTELSSVMLEHVINELTRLIHLTDEVFSLTMARCRDQMAKLPVFNRIAKDIVRSSILLDFKNSFD
jgi:hypothetical protein